MSKTFEQSLDEIARLVKYFTVNRTMFRAPGTKEAQARQELIDPLFVALGWDVYNRESTAPQYRDVVFEDSLEIEGARKAPDYAFRVGKEIKFYTEAKKPAVSVETDRDPAYQLRRYGWNAKLPLSILTNFESLVVYNCRIRPREGDKPTVARLQLYSIQEYADRWRELWDIFSKPAVLGGSFDQFVETGLSKRGTSPVDAEFLKDIEQWRLVLARNMAIRNLELSNEDLNDAVQRTIDRIIFLRIAEDRGIEAYERLFKLTRRENVYAELVRLFRLADQKYNSGLFDFTRNGDRLTPTLEIDDAPLKEIISQLYMPVSPYKFDIMPAEILGNVYEQFLGKVIHLTTTHQARVEDKPEVRKAGGVYYTPSYIVDYIVKQTVGKGIEGKSPKESDSFRVLDMACGSGSFLLGAYQYLLDYYLKWYVEHEPAKQRKTVRQVRDEWRLTTAERKRILTTHIFGVDIDRQAVEVTKLSLLLKVLEGESDESLQPTLEGLHERALPNLDRNIKCGNSLIAPDYFTGQMFSDAAELRRVKPFDWAHEYPETMKAGGFDCVIGNPPWGAEFETGDQEYLRQHYKVALASSIDSYAVFIERALSLSKPHGLLGYITPDTFLRKDDRIQTRRLLLLDTSIIELIETGPLFSKVRDTWCLVFIVAKVAPTAEHRIIQRKISRFVVSVEERLEKFGKGNWDIEEQVPQSLWAKHRNLIVGYLATEREQQIINKLERYPRLSEAPHQYRISRGEEGSKFALTAQPDGKFVMIIPENVERYLVTSGLRVAASTLTKSKVEGFYNHPKIWIIRIQKMRWKQRLVCTFDDRLNSAGMKTLQIIISNTDDQRDLKYLSGILASKSINFWCQNYLADDMNQAYLEKIPIRPIDFDDPADKARHDKMVALVEQMLELHKRLSAAKSQGDRELYERQIDATDGQIDALVYELYGLTEEEKGIVEASNL